MKYNIREKIATLTTIENDSLAKINNLISCCISDAVYSSVLSDDSQVSVDLDFGTLTISRSNNELRYKFVPSAKLEEDIVKAIKEKKNALDNLVLERLKNSLVSTYKDWF